MDAYNPIAGGGVTLTPARKRIEDVAEGRRGWGGDDAGDSIGTGGRGRCGATERAGDAGGWRYARFGVRRESDWKDLSDVSDPELREGVVLCFPAGLLGVLGCWRGLSGGGIALDRGEKGDMGDIVGSAEAKGDGVKCDMMRGGREALEGR